MGRGIRTLQTGALAWTGGLLLVGLAPALAQQAGPGEGPNPALSFGISTTLRASDNYALEADPAGTTYISDTRLSFGLRSLTQAQQISLDLSGVYRVIDTPDADISSGFEDPRLSFSYLRTSANARFAFEADYNRADLTFLDPLLLEDLADGDLTSPDGTLQTTRLSTSLETGITDPLGFRAELSRDDRRYFDTTDPGLYDRHTDRASATVILRVSPALEGNLRLSYTRYEAEDADDTSRDTRSISAGLTYRLSPGTTVQATLGQTEIEERFGVAPALDTTTRGTSGTLDVSHALANGLVTGSLSTDLTTAGRRTTLEVGRSLDMPLGELEVGVGLVTGDNIDTAAIGSLSLSRDLPEGSLTAALTRTVSVNDESEAQSTTRTAIGYRLPVNDLSSLAFDLSYARISDAGNGAIEDQSRGSLSARYTRQLTRDWGLSVGYEHSVRTSETDGRLQSNAIFLTLDRDFLTSF